MTAIHHDFNKPMLTRLSCTPVALFAILLGCQSGKQTSTKDHSESATSGEATKPAGIAKQKGEASPGVTAEQNNAVPTITSR